jgi:thiol:disulfide interchange protein
VTWLLSIFAGRGLVISLVAGLGIMVATWDRSRMSAAKEAGRTEVRVAAERKGAENAKKAEAARSSADKLPAGRVFDKRCRDCD